MDRRTVLGAMASFGFAGLIGCSQSTELPPEAGASIFQNGPLAGNAVAKLFKAIPESVSLPKTRLVGYDGPHTLDQLRGKTRLLSVWAEWCPDCLIEARQLGPLQTLYGGETFGIHGVLSGSRENIDVVGAQAVLAQNNAGNVPTWVEPDSGEEVFYSLATYEVEGQAITAIPALLLVDKSGVLRGRYIGDLPHVVINMDVRADAKADKTEVELFVEALAKNDLDALI